MRKIAIIQFLFLALFFVTCSPEKVEPKEKEESIDQGEVIDGEGEGEGEEEEEEPEEGYSRASFTFSGEYAEQKAASVKTESSDLFALQFYEVETQMPYAFVIGDDITQITVDFRTGQSYMLKITYIKNGQNIIFGQEGRWSSPFGNSGYLSTGLNQPYYSSDIFLDALSSPVIHLKDESGGSYVEIERFHGVIESFEITEENRDLSVELQRLVFGLTLNVDLPEQNHDTVYFALHSKHDGPREHIIPLTEGKGTLEIPYISLGFPGMDPSPQYLNALDLAVFGEYQENIHISIGTPDNYTLFFDDQITVTRNMMTVIDLNTDNSGETSNGGFTLNFGEEMLNQYIDLNSQ